MKIEDVKVGMKVVAHSNKMNELFSRVPPELENIPLYVLYVNKSRYCAVLSRNKNGISGYPFYSSGFDPYEQECKVGDRVKDAFGRVGKVTYIRDDGLILYDVNKKVKHYYNHRDQLTKLIDIPEPGIGELKQKIEELQEEIKNLQAEKLRESEGKEDEKNNKSK